ncbi:Flp pilus assembly complex ATPase component TadA [Streptomyces sp. AC495_CC817]|uniref:Flp pilus assembly complex ATPase component TadA n=1 Tax=Streptomyces sp. AC495_CC817 TaxID=2823900 RepID=UPI001C27F1C3|nr:Flp pilus assembly complex ATPase component TadA [Streptomyces sp. AC495_CC817]
MIPPSVLVAERIRLRLRAEGTDPSVDAEAAHGVALAEVRRFNDGALSRGEQTIDDEARCVRDALAAVSGFGVLQPLLDDDTVEEIWLNGPERIHVARGGVPERVDLGMTDAALRELVERMLMTTGRRVDISQPFVDASLPDGSRLHVAIADVVRGASAVNTGNSYTHELYTLLVLYLPKLSLGRLIGGDMLINMKIRYGAAALSILALVLAGCASAPAPQAKPSIEPATPSATSDPSETPAPVRESERGNLIKSVGDTFGLGSEDGTSLANFTVTAITVDPQCTGEFAEAPEHGHYVRLDIEGETSAALDREMYFASGSWFAIAENGTTFNGDPWSLAAAGCIDQTERLPNVVGPGERVTGAVILDVPTPHGVIVFKIDDGSGWEWEY